MPSSQDSSSETTRQVILDAAILTASLHGVARLSLSDVARAAGLSRPTLYRYFSSRDELLGAALMAETTALVERVAQSVVDIDDPRLAIATGVRTTLELVREHPLLDRIVRTEPEALVPVLVVEGGGGTPSFLSVVRATVEALLAVKAPDPDPVRSRRRADVIARLLLSYAVNAPDDPPEVVADSLADFLVLPAPDPVDVP